MYINKSVYFKLWSDKKGEMKSVEGNGRPSEKDTWSVEKYTIKNKFHVIMQPFTFVSTKL
jgi:hypothetical protein